MWQHWRRFLPEKIMQYIREDFLSGSARDLRLLGCKCLAIYVPGLTLLLQEAITLTQSRIPGLTPRHRPEMLINLILHCCFHIHFVHGQKKNRSQDILLTIVQYKRMSDSCTLSGPLYHPFFPSPC